MKLLLTYPNYHDSDRRAVIGDMLKQSEQTVALEGIGVRFYIFYPIQTRKMSEGILWAKNCPRALILLDLYIIFTRALLYGYS